MKLKKSVLISTICAVAIIVALIIVFILNGNKADAVYYGNIITMDEANPQAEAIAVKGDKIVFVGSKDDSNKFIGNNTKINNYNDNFIYPGFIDGHSHEALFASLEANGSRLDLTQYLKGNAEIMAQYIKDNPGMEVYKGFGWWTYEDDTDKPTHEVLDKYCPKDVPIVIVDGGGHSALLNQKAIEYFDIKNKISIFGTDGIRVDANGNPTGLLVETPRFDVIEQIKVSKEDLKKYYIARQDTYIKQGFTSIMDAGMVETEALPMVSAFKELAEEGKLKIKFRSYVQISEVEDNKLEKVDQIAKWAKEIKYDNFQIVGIKIFLDGVPEFCTSWTSKPYVDKSKGENYTGYHRWTDNNKQELIDIIKRANENNLMVHFHSMGEGATSYALDCFDAAREGKTDFDYRNGLCHLSMVNDSDFQRFIDNKINAFVAPHWASYRPGSKENEEKIYGKDGAMQMYKIKTFLDKGITTTFHTDGMCAGGVPEMIYSAVTRKHPIAEYLDDGIRGIEECIGVKDSLKCLTTTTAYTMKEENNLGCIKVGMMADFTIYDKDFTDDNIIKDQEILNAKLMGSVSSGKVIYPYYENK